MAGTGLGIMALAQRRRPAGRPLAVHDFTTGTWPLALDFARAGPGARVDAAGHYVQAAPDQPRFGHDPLTLAPRGLLVEAAATNRVTHSNAMTAASWVPANGLSAGVSSVISPDGVTPAGEVSAPPASNGFFYTLVACTPGQQLVFSYFRRFGSATQNRVAIYDNTNLAFILAGTDSAPWLGQALAGGWQRVEVPFTVPAGCTEVRVYPHRADSIAAATGTVQLWGAQVETGSTASSVIVTTGAAVTRAADLPGLPGPGGTRDIRLVYDDLSETVLGAQAVTPGWWPAQTRPHLRRIELYGAGVLV